MRILMILGTRPEVIKLAPVINEMKARKGPIEPIVCSTGQHREMLDQMMGFFGIAPDMDLDLMRPNQTPTDVAARAIEKVGSVIADQKPDWVMVQGDTTSAMAASIAGFYGRARVAHVEAGLRTLDPYRPFPEEMNRRVIGRVASLHFAPTKGAASALLAESVDPSTVHVVGNTVIDALFQTRDRIRSGELPIAQVLSEIKSGEKIILMTSHRRENFDDGIRDICAGLARFAAERPDWSIIFPVHPNPAICGPVRQMLGDVASIKLVDPLGYGDFIGMMDAADFIVTDSGGVQEEAASLAKPVIVMRTETERPEAVENGNAVLVGSDRDKIFREMTLLAANQDERRRRSRPCTAYGDGTAARNIVDALEVASRQPWSGRS